MNAGGACEGRTHFFVIGDFMIDLYPLMTVEYALKVLKRRFGATNVVREQRGICVNVKHPGRQDLIPVILTIQQAKYLAAQPISSEDLADEKYPADWPR